MISKQILTKNLSHPIYHVRFTPRGHEQWFIQRDEKGEVCSFRKAYPVARTGKTEEYALKRLESYLSAACMSKRCTVTLLSKKNKTKVIHSCGVDDEDIKQFFLKKRTIKEVISIEWIFG